MNLLGVTKSLLKQYIEKGGSLSHLSRVTGISTGTLHAIKNNISGDSKKTFSVNLIQDLYEYLAQTELRLTSKMTEDIYSLQYGEEDPYK